MKRKTVVQQEWERLEKFGQQCAVHGLDCGMNEATCKPTPARVDLYVRLTRRQFNSLWQKAERSGFLRGTTNGAQIIAAIKNRT
jgi:hypothetical protein